MKIRGLSATGIKDFLQCKLKVIFRYDREVVRILNDHAKVGIAVHEALEQFSRRMLTKQSFPDAGDYEFAVNTFMNSATSIGLENVSFYTDGKRMVTEFIDRFDPSEEILEIEHKFRITTPDGVPLIGAIDKVVKLSDDTIAVIDYKTARNALTSWQLQDDIQLSMYDLAASLVWPEFKNRLLFLDYVRIDKKVSTHRTEEDRETFNEFLNSTWLQMQKLGEEEVSGNLNTLCGWCDYRTYCPAYAAFVNSKDPQLAALTDMDDGKFLEHWENVAAKKSILEGRQRELKMTANLKFMDGQEIKAGGKELYSTQQARTNYSVAKVMNIIPQEDVVGVLNVNKTKLDRYVKDCPELKGPLSKIAEVNYNAPMYKTRAVKEEDVNDDVFGEDESAA